MLSSGGGQGPYHTALGERPRRHAEDTLHQSDQAVHTLARRAVRVITTTAEKRRRKKPFDGLALRSGSGYQATYEHLP